MKNVLHIRSSSNLESSFSRKMGDIVIELLKEKFSALQTTVKDLVKDPIPFLTPEQVQARNTGTQDTAAFEPILKNIDQLKQADILVIEASMYNFSIPANLKAWIDYICQPRQTFSYASGKPEGLVTGKKAFVVLARGGDYSQAPATGMDFQQPYLKTVLGFIGITDVEFVVVNGAAFGAEHTEKTISSCTNQVREVLCNLQ